MTDKKFKQLEQYLAEPAPLMSDRMVPALEKIAEYQQIVSGILETDKATIDFVKTIKDPKTHSGRGLLGLYRGYKSLYEGLDKFVADLKDKYDIKVNGIEPFKIKKDSVSSLWSYRLNWAREAIGHLAFIYKDDVRKAIKEDQLALKEMSGLYGI